MIYVVIMHSSIRGTLGMLQLEESEGMYPAKEMFEN